VAIDPRQHVCPRLRYRVAALRRASARRYRATRYHLVIQRAQQAGRCARGQRVRVAPQPLYRVILNYVVQPVQRAGVNPGLGRGGGQPVRHVTHPCVDRVQRFVDQIAQQPPGELCRHLRLSWITG